MTYTYLQQLADAHYFGYSSVKHSRVEYVNELIVKLSNCTADQRVATFEKVMRTQCDFELSDDKTFDCFRAGIAVLFDQLHLMLTQQLDSPNDYYDWRLESFARDLSCRLGKVGCIPIGEQTDVELQAMMEGILG
jgi:hypothetical protein